MNDEAFKDKVNNRSVVMLFDYGQVNGLLVGDIEASQEEILVERQLIPEVEILKVAHHGSKTSTSQVFLNAAKPKVALISVGAKNRFGHPHQEVLTRLAALGCQVRRTDEVGEIKLTTDGNKIW